MGSTSASIYGWKLKQLINVGVHYTTVRMELVMVETES